MATMNIKDPRVHELANELAALRGLSATRAVREALEHELERVRRAVEVDVSKLAALQARAAQTSDRWLTDADLYDDAGLPR
ncbi:type II toxin-antitoxin system VapB family antitoxin [Gordonia sp. (in: high G+C Gram-positive bacteria)]|uniref:type II toxin-antitoxin system VapB family antitoxin n=1 Tax=Gordonia sp. (in: high G+C Gram-positive bacteria) TaxID=84139 RepID=UPI0025B9055E|nr:type II toxin-antitoxin system VapB family antitoxin [Gordonia sp. (in: high G+C Gram-positive bacteria)]